MKKKKAQSNKPKKLPNYMKALSSKEPAPILNRGDGAVGGGGGQAASDRLEVGEVSKFRFVNNTRKIHYPMMLRKYQIESI